MLIVANIKKALIFSICVQILSKAIGLLANILLLRLLPVNVIGGFTMLGNSAQSISSIARLGTDYNYQVTSCALPASQRGGLQRQFLRWNACFSGVAALIALPLLYPSILPLGSSPLLLIMIYSYLLIESYVDVLWEPALANRDYSKVFGRHLQVAIFKAILPLLFGVFFGWKGLVAGLLIATSSNAIIAIISLRQLPYAEGKPLPLRSFLSEGIPFYLVPLTQQLIFWPALLYLGFDSGLESVGLLRVAQLVVQVVGILPTSIIPIVFIENAHGYDKNQLQLRKGLHAVALSGLAIFTIYSMLDATVLPIIFGLNYANAVLPARTMLLAAVCNGISQIFQQQAFRGNLLRQLSILQIAVLLIIAPIGIIWWLPNGGVEGYAWLTLAVSFFTLLSLVIWDPNHIMQRKENLLPAMALLMVSPLAIIQTSAPLAWSLTLIALVLILISSKSLLRFNTE